MTKAFWVIVCASMLVLHACGGEGGGSGNDSTSANQQTNLQGQASDKISEVTIQGSSLAALYHSEPMPAATEACSASGSVETATAAPGGAVQTAFGSLSAGINGVLVGVQGRSGYYEFSTVPDPASMNIMVRLPQGVSSEAFDVSIEPRISGTLRAPYFVHVTPAVQ